MDEQNTTTQQPVMIDSMPTYDTLTPHTTSQKTSYHHKKKWGWIIIAVVILAVVGLAVWFFIRHTKKMLTPAQTLQALKDTSKPVTSTSTQRAATVNTLNQKANPVPVSRNDQLNMLSKLSK